MIVCCLLILLPILLPDGGVQQQWHALRRISQGVNSLERESISVPDANIQGGKMAANVYRRCFTTGMADAHICHS